MIDGEWRGSIVPWHALALTKPPLGFPYILIASIPNVSLATASLSVLHSTHLSGVVIKALTVLCLMRVKCANKCHTCTGAPVSKSLKYPCQNYIAKAKPSSLINA